MPRSCTVCRHERLERLNRALADLHGNWIRQRFRGWLG